MTKPWRSLSQRTGGVADTTETLHDGLPGWIAPSIATWMQTRISQAEEPFVPIVPDLLHRLERRLHVQLNWKNDTYSAASTLLGMMFDGDGAFGLDVLDATIAMMSDEIRTASYDKERVIASAIAELQDVLEEAGSAWKVGFDEEQNCAALQQRVAAPVAAAAETVMSARTRAAEHLRIAWQEAYGRKPDASKAYHHAVKAVEAAAWPIVVPKNPKPTLGQIIPAMRDAPHKWRMRFTDPGVPPIGVVVETMKLLWTSQLDRHGTDDTQPLSVSLEEAQDAVHLAVLLVQWFESGAIATI